jgi:hypothetical protein
MQRPPLERYNNRKDKYISNTPLKLMVDQQHWVWRGKTDDEHESEPSWRNLATRALKAHIEEQQHNLEPVIV